MNHGHHIEPEFTALPDWFGLSASRPVRVSSWIPGTGPLRAIRPGSPDFPGWEYGDFVLTPEQQDRRPHDHQYYEICIIRSGEAMHCTDDFTDHLTARTVVVMTPGSVHSIYGIRDLVQTNLYYMSEWLCHDLSAFWGQEGLIPLFLSASLFRTPLTEVAIQFTITEEEMQSVDHEIADIGQECSLEQPSSTFLNMALLKLLMKLSRAYVHQNPDEFLLGFRPEVRKALEYIEQSLLQLDAFSVPDLAESVALSAGHFSAIFKEATGWTPMEYYQRRRVQHACRLLLEPDRQITRIALDLGYSDSAHLCHFFKRYQNMSPSEYRATLFRQSHPH
ncbi:MAG: helix-turn-helix domain-containing protein [Nitrospiraceae bacterium]|nr:helix-turn-helix domain-containing protein [Nitrospiraceae bacterium]